MPSITIRNVPDDVHQELRRRAAKAGKSLQAYLLAILVEQTSHPMLDEVLDRIDARSGGSQHFSARDRLTRDEIHERSVR